MSDHQDHTFEDLRNTVHEYARIMRRRWRLGLLGLTIVSSVAFWISQYLPREYGTTTLFERRDDVVLRNLVRSSSPYNFGQLRSGLALDIAGSRALAQAAITIGLLPADAIKSEKALTNEELRKTDEALGKYKLRASVRLVQSSPSLDTIELSCTANDPTAAREFIIALREGYIRRARKHITQVLTSTRDFFENELQRYQQQINETNHKLQVQFAEFHGITPTNTASASARLDTMESDCIRLAQRVSELEAQVSARENFLTSRTMCDSTETVSPTTGPTPVAAPPVLRDTDSKIDLAIRDVEQQIADAILMERMTNEHPRVIGLRRKLDNLIAARESMLTSFELTRAEQDVPASSPPSASRRLIKRDPVLAGHRLRIELELDALHAQMDIARKHLEEAATRKMEFATLYERMINEGDTTRELEGKLAEDRNNLAVWQQHSTQLQRILAANSEDRGTQFSLIEAPKENPLALKPQATAIFVVCSGCGLAAAALLIALAELTDRSFRSAGQVTRSLGLPILECITVIKTPKIQRKQLLARLVWTPALCLLVCSLIVSASLAYVSLEHPNLHDQAISKIDGVLQAVGAPSTSLEKVNQE